MSVFPKPYADLVARLRVASGFVLVLAFAWFSLPDLQSLVVGPPGVARWIAAARLGHRASSKKTSAWRKAARTLMSEIHCIWERCWWRPDW